jgi:hypothetical protein
MKKSMIVLMIAVGVVMILIVAAVVYARVLIGAPIVGAI